MSFEKCVEVILKNEGGYVDHPSDPGGRTKYGISQRAYPQIDIKDLTADQAKEIYLRDYWRPLRCDSIEDKKLALHMFDMGVNAGYSRAVKLAQKMIGISETGKMTQALVEDLNRYCRTSEDVGAKYAHLRYEFYNQLAKNKPHLAVFLKGWLNRIKHTDESKI